MLLTPEVSPELARRPKSLNLRDFVHGRVPDPNLNGEKEVVLEGIAKMAGYGLMVRNGLTRYMVGPSLEFYIDYRVVARYLSREASKRWGVNPTERARNPWTNYLEHVASVVRWDIDLERPEGTALEDAFDCFPQFPRQRVELTNGLVRDFGVVRPRSDREASVLLYQLRASDARVLLQISVGTDHPGSIFRPPCWSFDALRASVRPNLDVVYDDKIPDRSRIEGLSEVNSANVGGLIIGVSRAVASEAMGGLKLSLAPEEEKTIRELIVNLDTERVLPGLIGYVGRNLELAYVASWRTFFDWVERLGLYFILNRYEDLMAGNR